MVGLKFQHEFMIQVPNLESTPVIHIYSRHWSWGLASVPEFICQHDTPRFRTRYVVRPGASHRSSIMWNTGIIHLFSSPSILHHGRKLSLHSAKIWRVEGVQVGQGKISNKVFKHWFSFVDRFNFSSVVITVLLMLWNRSWYYHMISCRGERSFSQSLWALQ